MIKSLTSLRFVFALMIFMHHYSKGEALGAVFPEGFLGVTFFFILSGFILSYTYHERFLLKQVSVKDFLRKRIVKLYPLHLLCLLAFLILTRSLPGIELLPNVLLLQSWIPMKSYYFSGNAVSWCLSDEMFFYLVFPFLVLFIFRSALNWSVAGFIGILFVYFSLLSILPESYEHAFFYISPFFRSLDFMIGIFLYRIYKECLSNTSTNISFRTSNILEVGVVVILILMILFASYIPIRYCYASYYWLPMCLIILCFAYTSVKTSREGYLSKLFSHRLFVKLGEASFCFYMIHTLCITVFSIAFKYLFPVEWYFRLPVTLLCTILLSLLCYSYFEKPVSKWLHKKLSAR